MPAHKSLTDPLCSLQVNLNHNKLGDKGGKAIAQAISVSGSLTSVGLLGNKLDDETVAMLLKIKAEKPTLISLCGLQPGQTEANFSQQRLGPADAKLLALELVGGSLTQVFAFLLASAELVSHCHFAMHRLTSPTIGSVASGTRKILMATR